MSTASTSCLPPSRYSCIIILIRLVVLGTSLAVQWLGLHASTAGGKGLIPGRGTKIPHAAWPKEKTATKDWWCLHIVETLFTTFCGILWFLSLFFLFYDRLSILVLGLSNSRAESTESSHVYPPPHFSLLSASCISVVSLLQLMNQYWYTNIN